VNVTAILSVGVAVALALPLMERVRTRRFDIFEPIVVFSVAFGVMFAVRPLSMLIKDDTVYFGLDVRRTLPVAVLLALAGAVAFVVAYEFPLGRALAVRIPRPRGELDETRMAVAALCVGALGLLALFIVLPTSRGLSALDPLLHGRGPELGRVLTDTSTYLWYGSLLLIPASLAFFALALRRSRTVFVAGAATFGSLALLRTIPTGNRLALLVFLGGAVVFLYLRHTRRPGFVALAAGLALALVGSYFSLVFRDPDTRGHTLRTVERVASRPTRLFSPIVNGADAEMAPALAGALTIVPDRLSYRFGSATFGDLVIRPVPRQLWNGKPRPPGQEIVTTVWPSAAVYGFDPAFTPLLFFFWDFGIPGVLVGMALFGVIARLLYERLRLDSDRVDSQLLFAASLWFVVIAARNDPADTVVQAAFLLVPLAVILAIGRRAPEPGNATGQG
jgi:hypothetical protein